MENFEYKSKEQKKFDYQKKEEEQEGKECPVCGTMNDINALYCEECGYSFSGEKHCPKCGAKISVPNADICEVCGEWLIEHKCKFCYADLEEGAKFCSECGNPIEGIICPKCNQLSYFDFCKTCDIPLTESAKKLIEESKNNPQEKEFFQLIEDFSPIEHFDNLEIKKITEESKETVSEKEELLKLKSYIEKVDQQQKKPKEYKPLFTEKQKESIKNLNKIAKQEIQRQEEERKRREEEERRRKEEERRKKEEEKRKKIEAKKKLEEYLNNMQYLTFPSNQEARRYFRAHKPPKVIGWICNCCGVLHRYPEECWGAYMGGRWIIE